MKEHYREKIMANTELNIKEDEEVVIIPLQCSRQAGVVQCVQVCEVPPQCNCVLTPSSAGHLLQKQLLNTTQNIMQVIEG